MAAIGPIVAIASTVLGVVGSLQQAKAAQQAAEYQAQAARNMAKFTVGAGQVEEQAQRMKTNALIGQQRAAAAASGVEVNTGSPMDIQVSTQVLGELDAQTIRSNTRARAQAYQDQAVLHGMEADAAQTEGWLGAFGSILGGASSFAKKWTDPNSAWGPGRSLGGYGSSGGLY